MEKICLLIILLLYLAFGQTIETYSNNYLNFEQTILDLNLENSQLRSNLSNVALELAKTKRDNFNLMQASVHSNCSLTDQVNTILKGLKDFSANMEPIMTKLHQHVPKEKVDFILPKNCAEASKGKTGIYTIKIPHSDIGAFSVACDAEFHNANWLVIQRRKDGSEDFYRPWTHYKNGFGTLDGEFFIGLDKLHLLTMYKPQELIIIMEDFENVTRYAKYTDFAIGNEDESYYLKRLGSYSGTAGDSLTVDKLQKFSTYDRDNDVWSDQNCASIFGGAWWYKNCGSSNLNGLYLKGQYESVYSYGAYWETIINSKYSLKFIQMMIRPQKYYYN